MNALFQAGVIGVVLLVATSSASQSEGHPTSLLRRLQDIQDESAFGMSGPPGRREEIGARLEASVHEAAHGWADRRNFASLASFLLTGGNPALARSALSVLPRDVEGMSLVQQAVRYADGEFRGVEKQLEAINLRTISPEVAGALALVQARLIMEHDRKIASEKFLAARILAPGGLIEEAALRQELFILDNETDPALIRRIVGRYFSRFDRSAYAENFVHRLEALVEQGWTSRSSEWRANATGILEEAPIVTRKRLALRLARVSLMHGDRAGVRQALEIACAESPANGELDERCSLYRQIGEIGETGRSDDKKTVWQSPTPQLAGEDRLILECARLVEAQAEKTDMAEPSKGEHPETESMKRVNESIIEANQLLARGR